jgi:hypothetical protein
MRAFVSAVLIAIRGCRNGFLLERVMDIMNWLLLLIVAVVLIAIICVAYQRYRMIKTFEIEQARLQAYFDDQKRRGARITQHRIKL